MAWITKGDPNGSSQQEVINKFTFRVTGPVDTCPDWVPSFMDGTYDSERQYTIDADASMTIDAIAPDVSSGCGYYTTLVAVADLFNPPEMWKELDMTNPWPVISDIFGLGHGVDPAVGGPIHFSINNRRDQASYYQFFADLGIETP
jgi:hypothetical protein